MTSHLLLLKKTLFRTSAVRGAEPDHYEVRGVHVQPAPGVQQGPDPPHGGLSKGRIPYVHNGFRTRVSGPDPYWIRIQSGP